MKSKIHDRDHHKVTLKHIVAALMMAQLSEVANNRPTMATKPTPTPI